MKALERRRRDVEAHLAMIGAPPMSKTFSAHCVTCGRHYRHWAKVQRCAWSHGGGRIEVDLFLESVSLED